MPELPEVETIRCQLAKEIVGKKLKKVKVTRVRRRAKILIIDLADGSSLVFHLKLTGQLLLNAKSSDYSRAVFKFDDGTNLVFNNPRGLGWWKKVEDTTDIEKGFGPEPLDKNFTLKKFKSMLSKRKNSKIKPLLMDQRFIAGIGNIYSDEILFAAKIQPLRQVKTLRRGEVEEIFKAIKRILKAAIKHRGSTSRYYLDVFGKKGEYIKYHKVYRRENCPCCGTKIKKIKLGGRSAHYCPECQK